MDTNQPPRAANIDAPSDDDAADPSTSCLVMDAERRAADGDEIEPTTVDRCDACHAVGTVHVTGPCGGVLAFCADAEGCRRRQLEKAARRACSQLDTVGEDAGARHDGESARARSR
jgi:hypothetical protein